MSSYKFVLTLTHTQIELLLHLENGDYHNAPRRKPDCFHAAFRGLQRKGLAEHNVIAKGKMPKYPDGHQVKLKWVYRLTPAGLLTAQLIRLSQGHTQ